VFSADVRLKPSCVPTGELKMTVLGRTNVVDKHIVKHTAAS